MSNILIETTVRQTLKGLQEDPKWSIRNLVDMALHFSEGRFQNRFFQTARIMLEHEESAYYKPHRDGTSGDITQNLDEIISDDPCYAFFDEKEKLFTLDHPDCAPFGDLFQKGLIALLRQAYPKSAQASSR